MPARSFLTNHARVLLCIAHDPGLRLSDIAVKHKAGRRNRYQIAGLADLEAADRRRGDPRAEAGTGTAPPLPEAIPARCCGTTPIKRARAIVDNHLADSGSSGTGMPQACTPKAGPRR